MDPRCEEIRELAPELALGIVEGEERGRALEHLADCPACRRRVEQLSEVADELLMLAPHSEVPVGFESRVLDRVLPSPPAKKRRRRLALVLAPAAAAAAAVAITLGVVSDDLQLADHYRDTLSAANGREFDTYALRAASGQPVGRVFAYEGSPSWLLMTVDQGHRTGLKGAELVMDDGGRVPIRWFYMTPEWGSCGGAVRVDLGDVSVLRIVPKRGGEPLVAQFGVPA
jgi:Putative zinc-finger